MSEVSKGPRWIMLAVSGGLLVGSLAWAMMSSHGSGKVRHLDLDRDMSWNSADELAGSLEEHEPVWGAPVAQGGPVWVFDLFTPPVIYYDAASESFTVTPPGSERAWGSDFPFVLDGIDQSAYRYQLIAYAGTPGQYLLTLEDRAVGQDVFVAPGEMIPGTSVQVKSFEEKRIVPEGLEPGTTEVFDLLGVCVVSDPSLEADVSLVSGKISYLDESQARVHADDSCEHWVLSAGDRFEYAGRIFRVQSIDTALRRVSLQQISESGEVLHEGSLQPDMPEGDPGLPPTNSN